MPRRAARTQALMSSFDIPPVEAKFIDPQQRLLLELAWQALENAGVVPEQFTGRIGVYCGTRQQHLLPRAGAAKP